MDNLDTVNDDELRRRLIQYGFPNLPVTATTRKILIKKLRNYMEMAKYNSKRDTTYATRYSSDEDLSDRDSTTSSKLSQNTVYGSMPPPSAVKRNRISLTARNSKLKTKVPIQTKKAEYVPVPIHNADTEEDSVYNSLHLNSSLSSVYSRLSATRDSYCPSNNSQNNIWTSTFITPLSVHNYSRGSNSQKKIHFKRTSSTISHQKPIIDQSNGYTPEKSPYLSHFTKRLLNLRGANTNNSSSTGCSSLDASRARDLNDSSILLDGDGIDYETNSSDQLTRLITINDQTHTYNKSHNISIRKALINLIYKIDENYIKIKHTFVPCILVSILFLFFAIVAFLYLTISPDIANSISQNNAIYNLCVDGQNNKNLCIAANEMDSAIKLSKHIATELQKLREYNKCSYPTVPFTISARDIINFNMDKYNVNAAQAIVDLQNIQYLIHMNPKWNMMNCDEDGNILKYDEAVLLHTTTNKQNFAILTPRLPFMCLFYNKLQTFFLIVGCIGFVVMLIYLIYYLQNEYNYMQQRRKDTVNMLIQDIINSLMEKYMNEPGAASSLIIINHLRDKLIPPAQRAKLSWAWDEAITFLENNESRVQFEVGNKNGEDCHMIRWIDTVSSHLGQRPSVKKWQSPAFDKANKIEVPPTPCLKIRQMFEKHEANNPLLKQIIQDAILEKVGYKCKIYHIELDKNSCCVYVRCATAKDAGIVHCQINGWWFDSRLVSIKFLRVDRYVQRFPQLLAGPNCLRPSNTRNLSMTNCNMDKNDEFDVGENDINGGD